MPRLPRPGQDDGVWGDILNDFLAVSHMDDGTVRVEALPELTVADGSITPVKLSQAYVPVTQKGQTGGVATLDGAGKIPASQIPVGSIVTEATTSTAGIVQLAGDLNGTYDAPRVPALATKYELPAGGIPATDLSSDVQTKLNTGGAIGDANATTKGLVQLAGDLGGTASAPTVPALANKINSSALGAASGVATLDGTGKLSAAQIPDMPSLALDAAVVHLDGPETITGIKIFTSSPEVPDPETNLQIANKQYVDSSLASIAKIQSFSSSGPLMVEAGGHRLYNDTNVAWTITSVRSSVGVAPTGSSVVVDINVNGTTVFTNQANRPTIAANASTSGKVTAIDVATIGVGDYLTVDVDQVGSATPGSDLVVQVEVY
jgi:hypothetical protein